MRETFSTVRIALAVLAAGLATLGCGDSPTRPATEPEPSPVDTRNFGLMEITLSGVTSETGMSATARSIRPYSAGVTRSGGEPGLQFQSLDPLEEDDRKGLQLEPLTLGSFTRGERGNGGQRYLSATFRVRNASADGKAYTDPVNNVTLVAVATDATIGATPVSRMRRFDGSDASAVLAAELRPTGAVAIGGDGRLTVPTVDVLQAFTETEAADLAATAGLDNVFPYGFVVRNPGRPLDRRLAGEPAPEQFEGVVTLAFRIPLAEDPADDPFEISVMVLAASDSETRLTQSFEERLVCPDHVEARATALGATTVTLFAGGTYSGTIPTREIAQLRTAGTAASPTAILPDPVMATYPPPPELLDLSDSTGVVPLIWDVVPAPHIGPDDYILRFGYYNAADTVVHIPISPSNFFSPSPNWRNQPQNFQPGLHVPPHDGFEVLAIGNEDYPRHTWHLDGRNLEVHMTDPERIPTPPPCRIRT